MPTQTSTQQDDTMPDDVVIQELYNALMSKIEPELTVAHLENLDTKYKDETQEDRNKRLQRYDAAFTKVEDQLGQLNSMWKQNLQAVKRKVMKRKEKNDRKEDQKNLDALGDSFSRS